MAEGPFGRKPPLMAEGPQWPKALKAEGLRWPPKAAEEAVNAADEAADDAAEAAADATAAAFSREKDDVRSMVRWKEDERERRPSAGLAEGEAPLEGGEMGEDGSLAGGCPLPRGGESGRGSGCGGGICASGLASGEGEAGGGAGSAGGLGAVMAGAEASAGKAGSEAAAADGTVEARVGEGGSNPTDTCPSNARGDSGCEGVTTRQRSREGNGCRGSIRRRAPTPLEPSTRLQSRRTLHRAAA